MSRERWRNLFRSYPGFPNPVAVLVQVLVIGPAVLGLFAVLSLGTIAGNGKPVLGITRLVLTVADEIRPAGGQLYIVRDHCDDPLPPPPMSPTVSRTSKVPGPVQLYRCMRWHYATKSESDLTRQWGPGWLELYMSAVVISAVAFMMFRIFRLGRAAFTGFTRRPTP